MKYIMVIILSVLLFGGEDLELVKRAYNQGLRAMPDNLEALSVLLGEELDKDKIALGKKLFFEKRLSLAGDISCASCHSFKSGGVDRLPTAIGYKNRANPYHLNTPTVLNTAFSKELFWDGRSKSLQDQAKGPLQASFEMAITPHEAEGRIGADSEYQKSFMKIYGKNAITFDNITDAIAEYEKTLITKGRFDEYLLGDFEALNTQEKEGLKLFINKGCIGCHNGVGLGGQVMRKFPLVYHKIWSMTTPQYAKELLQKYKNKTLSKEELVVIREGFFEQADITQGCKKCHTQSNSIKADIGHFPFDNIGDFRGAAKPKQYFRVPLLRNVVRTYPYFHNGSIKKLEDAIKLMGTHQVRANLSDEEINKIVAFLKSVDGEMVNLSQ